MYKEGPGIHLGQAVSLQNHLGLITILDYISNQRTLVSSCDTLLQVIAETKMAVIAYYLSNDLEFATFVITAISETGVMIP